ncbi:hypothetical protein [Nannocystis sp. SCPEA4]|uniref:hypothetical protein n=1 Tax=Nannocystis sp. SCPEA4 TaxID=2996787 RepID=UPI00226F91E3|nr:hypothetical protein [Nannocystis sp. SCPEA4]MCY1062917.1 hypothetical protein [Nannocystis sp. SCPEA4]
MSTTSETPRFGRAAGWRRALVGALVFALARPVAAAPGGPAEAPATVEAALAAGDLATAHTLAEKARVADPSPDNWRREAEVCQRLADYACARAAWKGHLDALPDGADRESAEAQLAALEDMSRGTVTDEAPSTHRAGLDKARADKEAALRPKPAVAEGPKKAPAKRDRIVKKWYFWVTTIAIAAAAGAITGIAIQAARDERSDDLDEAARVRLMSEGLGLRF